MIIPERNEYLRSVLAGALSSMLSTIASQPLQVIKINVQLSFSDTTNKKGLIFITIRQIFQKDGLPGFWRGHITSQWFGIAHGITLFSTYHHVINMLNKSCIKDHINIKNYISGFFAGSASALIFSPVDLINTRKMYKITSDHYTSLYKGVKTVIRTTGFLGLYRGALINWTHLSQLIGLKFLIYNGLCNLMSHGDDNKKHHHAIKHHDDLKAYSLILCGAAAGVISCTITFPCEVIKRQLHVNSISNDKRFCYNIRSCTRFIYVNGGLRGFFKGLSPALTKSCLVTAICFSSYDIIAPLLDFLV